MPAWLTLMRWTAKTRSSGVRKRAFEGESGKKNLNIALQIKLGWHDGRADQNNAEVISVNSPVMIDDHKPWQSVRSSFGQETSAIADVPFPW